MRLGSANDRAAAALADRRGDRHRARRGHDPIHIGPGLTAAARVQCRAGVFPRWRSWASCKWVDLRRSSAISSRRGAARRSSGSP